MRHKLAVVETDLVGKNTAIGEFSIIRDGAIIGDNVIIHPHVIVEAGVVIGNGVEIFPGAYIGKEPKGAGALARKLEFRRTVIIGANSSINPNAVVYYDVELGENVLIGDGASIREQCRIGSFSVVGRHVTINYNVTIGERTKVMDHSWLAGNMDIGNNVFISGGVLTTNDNSMGRGGYLEGQMNGPVIEDNVKIGVGALLLPGVKLGRDAIIGAGAVVTKDVAAETVVMGVPARFVRSTDRDW